MSVGFLTRWAATRIDDCVRVVRHGSQADLLLSDRRSGSQARRSRSLLCLHLSNLLLCD